MKTVPLRSGPHNAASVEHLIGLLAGSYPNVDARKAFLKLTGYLLFRNHISEADLLALIVKNRVFGKKQS